MTAAKNITITLEIYGVNYVNFNLNLPNNDHLRDIKNTTVDERGIHRLFVTLRLLPPERQSLQIDSFFSQNDRGFSVDVQHDGGQAVL
jgi:hypothetical protein